MLGFFPFRSRRERERGRDLRRFDVRAGERAGGGFHHAWFGCCYFWLWGLRIGLQNGGRGEVGGWMDGWMKGKARQRFWFVVCW